MKAWRLHRRMQLRAEAPPHPLQQEALAFEYLCAADHRLGCWHSWQQNPVEQPRAAALVRLEGFLHVPAVLLGQFQARCSLLGLR